MYRTNIHNAEDDQQCMATPASTVARWPSPGLRSVRGSSIRAASCARAGSPCGPWSYRSFDELAERLHEKRTFAKLHVGGGACLALAYERDRTTEDIDVRVDTGHEALEEAIREIAQAHDLPEQWLNDQPRGFIPEGDDARSPTLHESQSLVVTGASGGYLLAMKLEKRLRIVTRAECRSRGMWIPEPAIPRRPQEAILSAYAAPAPCRSPGTARSSAARTASTPSPVRTASAGCAASSTR